MPQETDVRIENDQEPLLPVATVHAGVHGVCPPGVRANEGVDKSEIWMDLHEFVQNSYEIRMNSYEFMPTARLKAYWVLPLFVLGTVWPWWMLLGRDFHWLMGHETGP